MPNVHYLGSGKFPMGFMQIIHVGDWSKRVSTGLRKEQVKWMNEYIDQGGSAWIVVRIGRDFTGLFWGGDSEAIFVRPSSQDFVKIAAWSKSGNMVEQDWEDIQNIILNANSDQMPSGRNKPRSCLLDVGQATRPAGSSGKRLQSIGRHFGKRDRH